MVKPSVKAGQKANSKLACATNFPVDANDTRVSVTGCAASEEEHNQIAQGAGRNTQISAFCPGLAGTAKKRRSSSVTKEEVRAPAAVGIWAIRR